jgi:hypothetical protein
MSDENRTAVGIHDHDTFKLGLRPGDPKVEGLLLEDYLTGAVPDHPTSADYLSGIKFGMYGNDKFGVCGPTSVANSVREVSYRLTGKMVVPTQEGVYALYRQSGNPKFDPATGADDNGVDMVTMLNALMQHGIDGIKPLCWCKVGVGNEELLKAAVAVVGQQLYGVDLQKAQQGQTDAGKWSYSPSADWGGHAILGGAYGGGFISVVTWAQVVEMTDSFIQHQLGEAYNLIWPWHLSSPGFLRGVDLTRLAKDWEAFSGKPFPVPLPTPGPGPTPSPGPVPVPVGDGVLTIDVSRKTVYYPAGWLTTQAPAKSDFDLV